jgi:hypothetical protein
MGAAQSRDVRKTERRNRRILFSDGEVEGWGMELFLRKKE